MNAITNDIRDAIKKELTSACEKYPMFASMHKGIAVLFEEYLETSEELDNVKRYMDMAWNQIRLNNTQLALSQVTRIKYAAERLAIEACQVSAMAEKFIQSERRDKS